MNKNVKAALAAIMQTDGYKKFVVAVVAAMIMVMNPNPNVAQADAPTRDYYGKSAAYVAKAIGCKQFKRTGPALYSKDGGICYLKGKRVNIKTYQSMSQQFNWDMLVMDSFGPRFYWASGLGAGIVAKNGNRPAAVVGARALGGKVCHG
ncbi:MAG: hypothetical protein E6R04_00275 [Spirochaetes bacterium]|nr:MAG: hypothetical protein E6R04_00275 [Spirochaetota bacterium]